MLTGYEEENNILQCGRRERETYVNGELIYSVRHVEYMKSVDMKKKGKKAM